MDKRFRLSNYISKIEMVAPPIYRNISFNDKAVSCEKEVDESISYEAKLEHERDL